MYGQGISNTEDSRATGANSHTIHDVYIIEDALLLFSSAETM